MNAVHVTHHFGIVVRKGALAKTGLHVNELVQIMDVDRPLDENETLISFGPHFGQEAANVFIVRLEEIGLIYGDDFIDIDDTLPDWCTLYIGDASMSSDQ